MPEPWDAFIASQAATGTAINNALSNYNKLGQAKKTIDALNCRLAQLDGYWKTFFETHQQLYNYYDDVKSTDFLTKDYFSQIEEMYLNTKCEMTTQLVALVDDLQNTRGLNSGSSSGLSPTINTTSHSLPKLTLPKFGGRQEDWESFKELFCSMVKDSPNLTPVLKRQHLVSCLEGDARRRIDYMSIIGSNFEVAWAALETSYDNKRLRLTVQLNKLLSMPCASGKSMHEITRLMDTTN